MLAISLRRKKRLAVIGSKPTRLIASLMILSLAVTPAGCITKPPSLALHEELLSQRIALVPDRSEIITSLDLFAKSTGQGALRGAGEGISSMMQGLSGGSCSGEVCGAALLLYLAFAVVVGGTVGAIEGSLKSTSTKTSRDMEEFVDRLMTDFASHLTLAKKVYDQSREISGLSLDLVPLNDGNMKITDRELSQLAEKGYLKVLVVKLVKCNFVNIGEKGNDPSLGLDLEALVSITDSNSKVEDYRRTLRVTSTVRHYSEWIKMDQQALVREVDESFDLLAEEILNSLILSYKLPIDSGSWTFPGAENYGCCWICPITPHLKIDYFPMVRQDWPYVISRMPKLEWQPFPDEHRQAQFQEKTGYQAINVHYDLKIWETFGPDRRELVYERYALEEATHQVEDALKPKTRYLWSIRACFNLGENKACTPWSFSLIPAGIDACESTTIQPERNYYRFLTP